MAGEGPVRLGMCFYDIGMGLTHSPAERPPPQGNGLSSLILAGPGEVIDVVGSEDE